MISGGLNAIYQNPEPLTFTTFPARFLKIFCTLHTDEFSILYDTLLAIKYRARLYRRGRNGEKEGRQE